MGDYQPTRDPTRATITQDRLAVNLDHSSSMPSVKSVYTVEASSAAIHLPQEEGIKKSDERDKLRKYNSWK